MSRLAPGKLVDLYEIDVSMIDPVQTVPFRFTPMTNRDQQPVRFRGHVYTPFPIQLSGMMTNAQGPLPRPKLLVSNAEGTITALRLQFGDFTGAKLKRIRTFEKYLDGEELADPLAVIVADLWVVERIARETRLDVEFELVSSVDWQGQQIPNRTIYYNSCPWVYEGSVLGLGGGECDYTHGKSGDQTNMYDVNDNVTAVPAQDRCGKRLQSCQKRYGVGSPLPFGGFPATQRLLR